MKILVTSAPWKSAMTVMRSLGQLGHEVHLLTPDPCEATVHSKFCHTSWVSPVEDKKLDYLHFLFEHLRRVRYDLLIPISDLATEYVSEQRKDISCQVRVLLPSEENVDLARNKDKTYRFAQNQGIPIPKTFFPATLSDVTALVDRLSPPYVVKESQGTAGSGNQYFSTPEGLLRYFRGLPDGAWPMVQEFIQGKFYGFTAVCQEGEICRYFIFDVLQQYPDTGGVLVLGRSVVDDVVFNLSRDLVKKLKWTGAIDLDLFVVKDRGPLLLEINPRFSGTIQFALNCGVDLPQSYVQLAQADRIPSAQETHYRSGVYYRALFTEEIRACIRNRRHIPTFFIRFLRLRTSYDFSFDDPTLLWWQIKKAKWALFN